VKSSSSNDGDSPRACRDELGIVALDRSRDDDDRGGAEVGGRMADKDARAVLSQALDVGIVARIGTLHLVAEVEEHFGDAGHADAADADEVDGADFVRQLHFR
jgi:hypothetical protein